MLLAQHLAIDGQRLAEQGESLGVLALSVQADGHAVVAFGGEEMLLAQHLLADGQHLTQLRLRLAILKKTPELLTFCLCPQRPDNRIPVLPRHGRQARHQSTPS